LTINVLDPYLNNPPIANTDIANTLVNTPVTLKTLTNDKVGTGGAQLNPASVQVLGTVANGTTSVLSNGDIVFTPANNFAGVVTYMYRVCDNATPSQCDTAIQEITIISPLVLNTTQAADDYNNTSVGTPVSGNLLTNDRDPQNQFQKVTPDSTVLPGIGTLVVRENGSYTFTPVDGYNGPVNYPYTVCDTVSPVACAQATLYIIVNPFDADPDVNVTQVNTPVTGLVSTNDDVPPGTTYGTSPIPDPTNPTGATLVMNTNGTYTFTPSKPGVYEYEVPVCKPGQTPVSSCETETLTITVTDPDAAANPPIANTDIANNFMGMPEMVDNPGKIAHGTKKTVQKNQGFSLTFLNELELSILFDFVW
jgi:hypothetical protein